jgi:hypothetical protein
VFEHDLEAARIYADPSISPDEKLLRLEALGQAPPPAPDMRLAQNAGGAPGGPPQSLPDVPPAPIAAGSGGTTGLSPQQQTAPTSVAAPTDTGQLSGATPGSERRAIERQYSHLSSGQVPDEVKAANPQAFPEAAGVPPGIPVSAEEGPAVRPGVAAGDYRNAASRAALLLGAAGGPKVPTETVREEQQVQEGTLSPDARDAYMEAQTAADDATVNADYWQKQQELGALDAKARAAEEAMSERTRFEQIKNDTLTEAKKVNDRRNAISEEIAAAPPAEEGLFVGMNTGEKILSFLGMMLLGFGLAQKGKADQIIPTLKQMAMREVDKQKAWVDAMDGKVDALGTIYERHLANLKDEELASQAAISDIMHRAEVQTLGMLRDSGANLAEAQLQAKIAGLEADRIERLAKLDAAYGDKVSRSIQLAYQRERAASPRAQAAAAPAALTGPPQPEQFATDEEYFTALANYKAQPPAAATPPAAGKAPARGPTVNASGTSEGGEPPAKAKSKDQQIAELHAAGRTDEAVGLMDARQRNYLGKLFKQAKKDLGDSATDADAMDQAFQRLNLESPVALIPQSARGRVVTLSDGTQLFAPTDAIAKEVQPKLAALDNVLGSMRRLRRLADSPARNTNPALRSEIANLSHTIKFSLSKAQEQGVVREAEMPLYDAMSGGALGQIVLDPTRDVKRELDTTISVFAAERRRMTQNLSKSWTGEGGYRRVE